MKKYITKIFAVSAFALCFLAACDSNMYTVSTQLEEPVYVRPVSPGPGYVWIGGDWVRGGSGYTYRQGYWARPRTGRTYVNGSWQPYRNGYRWRAGHWRR